MLNRTEYNDGFDAICSTMTLGNLHDLFYNIVKKYKKEQVQLNGLMIKALNDKVKLIDASFEFDQKKFSLLTSKLDANNLLSINNFYSEFPEHLLKFKNTFLKNLLEPTKKLKENDVCSYPYFNSSLNAIIANMTLGDFHECLYKVVLNKNNDDDRNRNKKDARTYAKWSDFAEVLNNEVQKIDKHYHFSVDDYDKLIRKLDEQIRFSFRDVHLSFPETHLPFKDEKLINLLTRKPKMVHPELISNEKTQIEAPKQATPVQSSKKVVDDVKSTFTKRTKPNQSIEHSWSAVLDARSTIFTLPKRDNNLHEDFSEEDSSEFLSRFLPLKDSSENVIDPLEFAEGSSEDVIERSESPDDNRFESEGSSEFLSRFVDPPEDVVGLSEDPDINMSDSEQSKQFHSGFKL